MLKEDKQIGGDHKSGNSNAKDIYGWAFLQWWLKVILSIMSKLLTSEDSHLL